MVSFKLNGKPVSANSEDSTPLLWVIRDELKLTGTKYGCGVSQCGACTVHVNGKAVRSCVTTLGSVKGASVTTIEGLSANSSHPLQKAWIAEQVPQCGYCQSGMIMTAAVLLRTKPHPTDDDIDGALGGHICRCGTYQRIRAAIHRAAAPAPVHAKQAEGRRS